jgi:predicted kinase
VGPRDGTKLLSQTMTTLFLICGLPGSGKSTLAKRIERERPALRLTPDEWMERIVGTGYDEGKRAAIESLQWDIAQRALALGVDVVLESGFWSRDERYRFRARAVELGADSKLIFLDVPLEELRRRLATRNETLPADSNFRVDLGQLDIWTSMFERPTPDELE